jgi:hypothetical protein
VAEIQQQIADGARPLARVGDVIERGQPIPANARTVRDKVQDLWDRDPRGGWILTECRGEPTTEQERADTEPVRAEGLLLFWAPLTVVEVDPEPQPAEPASSAILVVGDDIEWGEPIPDHVIRMVGRWPGGQPDGDPIDLCLMTETGNGGVTWWSAGGDENWSNEDIPQECYPLRITRVREAVGPCRRCAGLAVELAATQKMLDVMTAPESGPVVLSLPQVPDGAVALIGEQSGRRYVRYLKTASWEDPDGAIWPLHLLFGSDDSFTVEFAPPREPRTWPKIEAAPDDLPRALDLSSHPSGSYPVRWVLDDGHEVKGMYVGPLGNHHTLPELRAVGWVTEVLDGQ